MFINIIQKFNAMGFWSWLWRLITGGESRLKEEKREEKDELKSVQLTEKEKGIDKRENKQLKEITKKLKKIYNKISKGKIPNSKIEVGNQSIYVAQAVLVLWNSLIKLINTKVSIKQEESTLSNIRNYWAIIRRELMNNLTQKDIVRVNFLFKELGIELKIEEEITAEKLKFIQQEWKLAQKEIGKTVKTKRVF